MEDVEALAKSVMDRLDRGERLSAVVPAARRLADLQGDLAGGFWLKAEDVGLEGIGRVAKGQRRPAHEEQGLLFWMRLHAAANLDVSMDEVDRALERGLERSDLPERSMVLYQSISELEAISLPAALEGMSRFDRTLAQAWGRATIFHGEAQRVLARVRSEIYQHASRAERSSRNVRRLVELFGRDAVTVFATGAAVLNELTNSAASLGRPGMASTAAQQARTCVLEMGRLGPSGGTHRSPTTGKTYELKGEVNRLHALLDRLHERSTDQADRKRLEDAHYAVETAYELGSRAKTPSAITDEQAKAAVLAAYQVAHALCFTGGFPPPMPSLGS